MGFWTKTWDWLTDVEAKSSLPTARSAEDIRKDIVADQRIDLNAAVSAVYGCARVIAEGLALPPCYVTRDGEHAATHPLYYLLNASPNDLQTAYEFREMQGYHMALDGNAYSWLNRAPNGSILEILPLDPHYVQVVPTSSRLGTQVKYFVFGVEMPADEIWHQKGPATKDYTGLSMLDQARSAIKLARHQEEYGAKLFENGARPAGLLTTNGTLTPEQRADLKRSWEQQYSGTGNAHKTALLTGDFQYHPLGSTANEAQFIEARKFQIEEICRFFRVSPTKLFHNAGSQSYASVEQAHIAHDADTDAHWHARFVQSANKTLLTQKERAKGYQIVLDNRDFLRGTAVERMQYYQIGRAIGVLSANEIREMEGFERSADPAADQLAPAANLFGGNDGGADRPPA